MNKDLHIVASDSARELLASVDLFCQCIVFYDKLHLGPLCHLKDEDSIRKRVIFLTDIFGHHLDIQSWVNDDLDNIQMILELADYKNIYLWLGEINSEKLMAAQLIYYLADLGIPIYIMDLSGFSLINRFGRCYPGHSISWYNPSVLKSVFNRFRRLSSADIQTWKILWKKLLFENTSLRICGQEEIITSVDKEFLSSILYTNCEKQFKRASMVIGMALCSLYNIIDIGDISLNYFLIELCRAGKLKYRGILENISDYEVCLV